MAMIKCPECGKDISNQSDKCIYCGFPIRNEDMIVCSNCGVLNQAGSTFCSSCGNPLVKGITAPSTTKAHKSANKKKHSKKRHSKAPLFMSIFFLLLILIAVIVFRWAIQSGRLEVVIKDPDTNESYQLISSSGLFNVALTIPAEYVEGTTQKELNKQAKEGTFKSATLNKDGSVTYVMSKSQHKEMLNTLKDSIADELNKIPNSTDYPNVTKVEANGFKPKRYTAAPYTVIRSGDSDALTAKRDKTIRALERLKKLFLFEDDAMSEKEYLMSKRELEGTLSDIENELSALEADTADTKYDDMSFISTASGFLIAHQIASGEHINYRELACAVDAKVLKDFVNSVIERIVLLDGRVASIEFKNGLVHEFLYRE